jgi:hypothetical protein
MAGVLSGDRFPLPRVLEFLLEVGKAGFSCHVEIEFAVDLKRSPDELHEFAFLQIRPMVFAAAAQDVDLRGVDPSGAIAVSGRALGHGHLEEIRDVVYVRPEAFDRSKTVEIAGEIGSLNKRLWAAGRRYLLIGPGRWGSADKWLGIPVGWSQISSAGCIVETEMEGIKVEPSQGTHFFQNITSFGIGYFTIGREDPLARLDAAWLDARPAESETEFVRHLSFGKPLEIVVSSKTGHGVIMKPGVSVASAIESR